MMELLIIPAVVALDQIVKWYIRANFQVGETLPVISDIVHITYVQNQGAAFSMFRNMPIVTVLLPIVMVIACIIAAIYFLRRSERVSGFLTALIAAGGIGNLIDRLVLGYVTDMIDFRVFPVFNVADIAVTVGCVLLIVWVFLEERRTR
jgi:signal peptidase II